MPCKYRSSFHLGVNNIGHPDVAAAPIKFFQNISGLTFSSSRPVKDLFGRYRHGHLLLPLSASQHRVACSIPPQPPLAAFSGHDCDYHS